MDILRHANEPGIPRFSSLSYPFTLYRLQGIESMKERGRITGLLQWKYIPALILLYLRGI